MTHLAYNLTNGEILTTNRANHLKRWVMRHTANDRAWAEAHGENLPPYVWVYAHGATYDDCVAKLSARGAWG
jgi:hypothetical protein